MTLTTLRLSIDALPVAVCLRELEQLLEEAPAVTRAFVVGLLKQVDPLCETALEEREPGGPLILTVRSSAQLLRLVQLVRDGSYVQWQAYLLPATRGAAAA